MHRRPHRDNAAHQQAYRDRKRDRGLCIEPGCWSAADGLRCVAHTAQQRQAARERMRRLRSRRDECHSQNETT